MPEYIISGGAPLVGRVQVSGAKNAVLPVLSACLLCSEGTVTLNNCPSITDVTYTLEILKKFGCVVSFENGQITVDAAKAVCADIPIELTEKLRSSSLFLGAALARFKGAKQSIQGGCELGSRPIDMHIDAFKKMGVDVYCDEYVIECKNSPHSTDIFLRIPSVGATENIILAATLTKGITSISNAAREPEIIELCNFINAMGGNISGAGSSIIVIQGVEKLKGINYNIIGDRIEAATFMALAIATDGEINVSGVKPAYMSSVTDVLVNCGGFICRRENGITVKRSGHFILSPGSITTQPFPGFPTDAQSVVMAMLLKCHGKAYICEQIFDDRLRVATEFIKMGADISVDGNVATICGVETLKGADVTAGDLRSGAALVCAALCAEGKSVVRNVCYIERGYSDFVQKLCALGADIIKT